jgi:hypothetical protein
MINEFNDSSQDLDFFWLHGSWRLFREAIERFEQSAHGQIIEKRNIKGKIFDFVLSDESGRNVKIQFIFGREECNASFILHTFDLDIVQVAFNGSIIVSVIMFCLFFNFPYFFSIDDRILSSNRYSMFYLL